MFVTLYDFRYSETKLDIFLQHCCICIIKKVNGNVQTITHDSFLKKNWQTPNAWCLPIISLEKHVIRLREQSVPHQ